MVDYSYNYCDLRTQFEQAQANLLHTWQTQQILMAIQAPREHICQQPFYPPASIQQMSVYPPVKECCCEDYSTFRQRRTNCKNCGAPLTNGNLCVYCDTNNV